MSEMPKAQELTEATTTQEAPALIIVIPETNDPAINTDIEQWAEANHGPAEFHTTETQETLEIAWLTPAEIRQLHAEDKLRSPEFVMDSLYAYEATIA